MNEEMKEVMTTSKTGSESFNIQISNPMLYDRLHALSAEYSLSMEVLVNVAVQRLVAEVDFVRNLRIGKIEGA